MWIVKISLFLISATACVQAWETEGFHPRYKAKKAGDSCSGENQAFFGGQCYSLQEKGLTWEQARKNCIYRGGDLAGIAKPPVADALAGITELSSAWVGMLSKTRIGKKVYFTWVDGTEASSIDIDRLRDSSLEGCIVFDASTKGFEVQPCDNIHSFVCEESMQSMGRMTEEMEKEEKEKQTEKAGNSMEEIETVNGDLIAQGMLTNMYELDIDEPQAQRQKRNMIDERMEAKRLWPDKTVPFYIVADEYYEKEKKMASFSAEKMFSVIRQSIGTLGELTCLNFVEYDSLDNIPRAHIKIKPAGGCHSPVGHQGGGQTLSLDPNCQRVGTIQHEMMHALGFWHEQARPDRDDYLDVKLENIITKYKYAFAKMPETRASSRGFSYDYNSIMQYPQNAFARKGTKTIIPRPCASPSMMGQRKAPTANDIAEINALYKCNVKADGNWGIWSCWSECTKTCGGGTRVRQRECNLPSPRNGGAPCSGKNQEAELCYMEQCEDKNLASVSLGCWNDPQEPPLLAGSSLEGKHKLLQDNFIARAEPFGSCRTAAYESGYKMFALRGGECFGTVGKIHHILGPSDKCAGTGSADSIDVFLVYNKDAGTRPDYVPQYGAWRHHGSCSKTCGGGLMLFSRECNNPPPAEGSNSKCDGDPLIYMNCAVEPCPDDSDNGIQVEPTDG